MPMTPLMERFPELGATRNSAPLPSPPRQELPRGEYGFLELYCDEPGCDCRRMMIDRVAAGNRMEQDLGHHQLRLGESGLLPEMGRTRQRSHRNQGAVPRPDQPTNQVLACTPRSVSISSAVARVRGTHPTALPDVPGLGTERIWPTGNHSDGRHLAAPATPIVAFEVLTPATLLLRIA